MPVRPFSVVFPSLICPMKHIHIELETYDTLDTLSHADRALVEAALDRLGTGHAPYSQFHVSAACQSADGQVWIGTNQENASYPVGICAERVAISVANMQASGQAITAMAIVYRDPSGRHQDPLAPCGMCRQALSEQSQRQHAPIRLLLANEKGATWVCADANALLPLSFSLKAL
ncbi:MAG: cytidine deaminase [Flavobacteriia bacterium]|jgi:cytidine deaminase|nr:cytidine deaminase [Flavobacteriia bacterium]NDA07179.1 cytidine deaminase [Flavobacteriia bacterium]NDA28448.1 cytidine deaminase [Flavobacteriia bacterium]NDD19919.1 cytidine deaminase [Flavobacteriia bacterium]NDD80185.1 cytidine deaminase [Flavobacteriia bacterium]